MRKEFEQLFLQLLDQAYETSGEPWGAMWFAGAYQPVGKFNAELRVVNEVTFERGGYAIRLHSDNQTLDGVRNTIAVRASDPASQMQIRACHQSSKGVRCSQKSHAQGVKRSRAHCPARLYNAAQGFSGRNPEGTYPIGCRAALQSLDGQRARLRFAPCPAPYGIGSHPLDD